MDGEVVILKNKIETAISLVIFIKYFDFFKFLIRFIAFSNK